MSLKKDAREFFKRLYHKLRYTTPGLKWIPVGKNIENKPVTIDGVIIKSFSATNENPINIKPSGGSKYLLIPSETGLGDKQPSRWLQVIVPSNKELAHLLIYEFAET